MSLKEPKPTAEFTYRFTSVHFADQNQVKNSWRLKMKEWRHTWDTSDLGETLVLGKTINTTDVSSSEKMNETLQTVKKG